MSEKPIDYSLLEEGFTIHQNRFTKYYHVLTETTNEEGEYQFSTKDFKDTAERLCSFLNTLLEDNKKLYLENQKYKNTIQAAVKNERTELGHNTLCNLAANMGIKI